MTTKQLRTMTVGELIETLQDFDPDMQVAFSYNYGDHCNTRAVGGIRSAEPAELTETAYSESGLSVKKQSDDDENEEQAAPEKSEEPQVLILSSYRE